MPASWQSVGAQGVIKGELKQTGGSLEANMHFFEVPKGATATLSRSYRGSPADLRKFMHTFANEVVKLLTGQAAAFGTRLTFARRDGVDDCVEHRFIGQKVLAEAFAGDVLHEARAG